MREIPIRGDTIRLGQLLKLAGVVGSGAEAKALLADGRGAARGQRRAREPPRAPAARRRRGRGGGREPADRRRARPAGSAAAGPRPPARPRPPASRSTAEDPSPRGLLVIAHRGAWDPAPQNSIAAFERAVELGADGFELDVRRTADGRLVVIHDQRIGVTPVGRLTAEALRERLAPGQAPDLDDVLAALSPRRALVDVELKEDGYVDEAMARPRAPPDPRPLRRHLVPRSGPPPGARRRARGADRPAAGGPPAGARRSSGGSSRPRRSSLRCTPRLPGPACSSSLRAAGCPPGCGRSTSRGCCARCSPIRGWRRSSPTALATRWP